MDNAKTGELIRSLRRENGLTQLQLAEKLHVSDKAVSKWERGMGCPDVSLIAGLSRIFNVDIQNLLSGDMDRKAVLCGDMRRMKLYVCPDCGNLVTSLIETPVVCCGRKLKPMTPVRAEGEDRLDVRIIENDYFVTSGHEMTKEHYITFVALVTADAVVLKKQYPEWSLQTRIPVIARGRLIWHCSRHGLFCQEVRP